ncbi:MAG TPA: hypothetical protein VLT83_17770 [Opitutaceae bacterium]|nr:hypothetical protein [Opitutaceae bacterium]
MKRIALAAMVLLLGACQTGPEPGATKDYAALAAAAVARFTIADNDVYGFTPEGRFDPSLSILESRREGEWTVQRVADRKYGFDYVEVTVDASGTIVRLQFFKTSRTSLGWREFFSAAYQDLKTKYKAIQRVGDNDTEELTVYVAKDETEWKQHYSEYLQLMDEPNNLGAQNCWILHPHLSLIQAVIKRQGVGAVLRVDFQTKLFAAAAPAPAGAAK